MVGKILINLITQETSYYNFARITLKLWKTNDNNLISKFGNLLESTDAKFTGKKLPDKIIYLSKFCISSAPKLTH